MVIHGKCHCGNIVFALDWPGSTGDVVGRACNCTFCIKHGGVWTSNPDAKLSVAFQQNAAVSKYSLGTATATFHICMRCGVVPIVTSEIANRSMALSTSTHLRTLTRRDCVGKQRVSTARSHSRVWCVDRGIGFPTFAFAKVAPDGGLSVARGCDFTTCGAAADRQ